MHNRPGKRNQQADPLPELHDDEFFDREPLSTHEAAEWAKFGAGGGLQDMGTAVGANPNETGLNDMTISTEYGGGPFDPSR